jgi:hypothetical protein
MISNKPAAMLVCIQDIRCGFPGDSTPTIPHRNKARFLTPRRASPKLVLSSIRGNAAGVLPHGSNKTIDISEVYALICELSNTLQAPGNTLN